jgi:hypothetical protein
MPPLEWRRRLFAAAKVPEPDGAHTLAGGMLDGAGLDAVAAHVFDGLVWDGRTVMHGDWFRDQYARAFGVDPQLLARRALRGLWERRVYLLGRKKGASATEGKSDKSRTALNVGLAFIVPAPENIERFVAVAIGDENKPRLEQLRSGWREVRLQLDRQLRVAGAPVPRFDRATEEILFEHAESIRTPTDIDPEALAGMMVFQKTRDRDRGESEEKMTPNLATSDTAGRWLALGDIVPGVKAGPRNLKAMAKMRLSPMAVAMALVLRA